MSAVPGMLVRGALLLGLAAGAAQLHAAEPLAEVQDLLKAGRTSDALRALDSLIAQRPNDAQLRFQKGVILADQKRTNEAIQVFQKLNQDFPALPEPFNNLAVLYVEQGQLDKARSALEAAIRSRPNYGTAFQNLGDVYTRMASRAYAKALQVEDPEAAPKLALLRDLYDMPQPAATVVAAATPAPRPAAASSPAPAAAPAASAAAPVASPAPPPPAAARGSDETKAVAAAVREWASAWSRKDMNDYFAAYVSGFKGSDASASEWQSNRRERITTKRRISVDVSNLKIDLVNDTTAKATFRQSYAADLLRVSSQKTLELELRNGKWLIRKESTG